MQLKVEMKLKQRTLVTVSLFLTMGAVFFLGVLFSYGPDDPAEDRIEKDTQRVELPDIPDVSDNLRVNNPDNSHKSHLNDLKNDISIQEQNRRLQQQNKNTDESYQQLRGAELLNMLAQQDSDKLKELEKHFELPPEIADVQDNNQPVIEGAPHGNEGVRDPWKIWHSWVKQDHFYPEDAFQSEEMNSILHAMATYPITSFDVGHRGTQLKASMYLRGDQRTAFKPMRQVKTYILLG